MLAFQRDCSPVGKGGRNVQIAGPHTPQKPKPVRTDTPIRETTLWYANKLKNKGGCVSPGKTKFDAARKLLILLEKQSDSQ